MRNITILSVYDAEQKINKDIWRLIEQINTVSDKLILVFNGDLNEDDLICIRKVVDCVIVRKNEGYDFGAYKEALIQFKDLICKYETVTLCNDTFFGFFESIYNIYNNMNKKDCDFWGINYISNCILDYLESYFLVFKSRIIENKELYKFIELADKYQIQDLKDVHAIFEVGLFQYLKHKKYKYGYYIEPNNINIYVRPYDCIFKYNLPLLKKKAWKNTECFKNKVQLQKAINYIKEKNIYDINLILQYKEVSYNNNTNNLQGSLATISLSESELLLKLNIYKGIFIYGAGVVARKLWFVYRDLFSNFKGFIVTDNHNNATIWGYSVKSIDEVDTIDSCIIVAMNKENSKQVYSQHKRDNNYIWLWNDLDM